MTLHFAGSLFLGKGEGGEGGGKVHLGGGLGGGGWLDTGV